MLFCVSFAGLVNNIFLKVELDHRLYMYSILIDTSKLSYKTHRFISTPVAHFGFHFLGRKTSLTFYIIQLLNFTT